jgi:hypothetical protein
MKTRVRTVVCLIAALFAFCLLRSGRCPNALCSAKPSCWIRCHQPAEISTVGDLLDNLRSAINPELSLLDRWSGFFTTPIFKMSGIQGWRGYGRPVSVEGTIVQVGHSLDGMTTVDLRLWHVSISGHSLSNIDHKFLRMEVFGYVGRHVQIGLKLGQSVRVYGELMWDGDGFLEVHPSSAADISDLKSLTSVEIRTCSPAVC